MKSVYEYILEARESIGSLPFTREEFAELIEKCFKNSDDDYENAFQDKIVKIYGEKAFRTLWGWIEGNWYNTDPNDLYDILLNMPKGRIDRCLGAGSNGAAIDMGDRVCKMFHKNTPMISDDRKFYEYCLKHKTNVFPVVYKLGKSFVIMEKLKPGTPKCVEYDQWIGYNPKKRVGILLGRKPASIEDCILKYDKYKKDIDKAVVKLEPIGQEVFKWALEVKGHLDKALGRNVDGFLDLRLANIGERADGSIIWFDI